MSRTVKEINALVIDGNHMFFAATMSEWSASEWSAMLPEDEDAAKNDSGFGSCAYDWWREECYRCDDKEQERPTWEEYRDEMIEKLCRAPDMGGIQG